MKTLTSPVSTPAAAVQSGWCEVYDFYLGAAISTPWGTISILRLTTLPGGISFFSPQIAPEPAGTQGNAINYIEWPISREVVKGDAAFQDDKLQISASNVTQDWAAMIARVKWYDTPVVIRKVPLFQTGLTANDCVMVFSGLVSSITITASTVQLTCSSSLGTLDYSLPNENMHASCRFRFGDDMCTLIKYLPANYITGTAGVGSSTTNIKSFALTQDTGSSSGYGTDLVDALPASSITASSQFASPVVNAACSTFNGQGKIFFANNLTIGSTVVFSGTMPTYKIANPHAPSTGTLIAGHAYTVTGRGANYVQIATFQIFTSSSSFTVTGTLAPTTAGLQNVSAAISNSGGNLLVTIASHNQVNGTLVYFTAASMPGGLTTGTGYYIIAATTNTFEISLTSGGAAISFSSSGTSVLASTLGTQGAFGVKASAGSGWAFTNSADWGTNSQGYWQITSGQEGLKNPALTPYIQFDFGSAVTPNIWRVSSFAGVQPEERVRLIEFFSSPDASTWKFETYFEMPNIAGQLFDVMIPGATSARYWRICVRSRWAESLYFLMFQRVSAYSGSRNWWADGQITFDGNGTAALKGVSRQILTSFSGELFCAPLPAIPAVFDTFVVQRGCSRTFNACCARLNTENYGGFNDLELQNVVNFVAQ